MAERLASAVLEISIDHREALAGLAAIEKRSDEAATRLRGIGQAIDLKIFQELGKIAGDGLLKVAQGVIALGERGAQVSDVAGSFSMLTGRIGETSEAMLGKLRAGVVGTLTDYDLMVQANKALGGGIIKTADDMGTLSEGARALAKATGGTTAEAFDTLTKAIATGKAAGLAQIGLFVDSKRATLDFAEAHGKTVDTLTRAEKVQAVAAASLAALRQRLQEIAPDGQDFGEMIEAAGVTLKNFHDQLAVAVSQSPVLAAGMKALGLALNAALGSNQQNTIQATLRVIEGLAIGVADVASVAVKGASWIGTAFQSVKIGINAVLEGIASGVGRVAGALANFAELAAKAPGKVGEQWASIGSAIRGVSDTAKSLAVGFGDLKDKQAAATISMQDGFGKVEKVIGKVRDAMVAAQGTTATAAAGHGQAMRTMGAATDELAQVSKADTAKIAAAFLELQNALLVSDKVGIDKRLAEAEAWKNKELLKLDELKGLSAQKYSEMASMVETQYKRMTAAALNGPDDIRDRYRRLADEIALATTTGMQRRLLELDQARAREIEGLAYLKEKYLSVYSDLVTQIGAKFDELKRQAQGYFGTVQQAASAAGFKSRAELEETAAKTAALYKNMLESGLYTESQLQAAHEAAVKAQEELDEKHHHTEEEWRQMLTSSSLTMLSTIFGQNKAAAIANALINAAQGIMKCIAEWGLPWGLVPAAAVAALCFQEIQEIKSTKIAGAGFAAGTPNLDFSDFGSASLNVLHNQEAVIPRGRGHVLAGEIAAALGRPAGRGASDDSLPTLRKMLSESQIQTRLLRRALRGGLLATT